MRTVGVFDSGVGGKSIAEAVRHSTLDVEVIFVNDSVNVPYGTKSSAQLRELVIPILQDLASKVDAIIIACNTVSTLLAEEIRKEVTVPIIALEPMVKPAGEQTESGVIAVCATPATLNSERYKWLKDTYAKGVTVLEPDCSDWATMIETDKLDHDAVRSRITAVCEQGADIIVLGCTHYHWIEDQIKEIAAQYNTKVIQPEQAIIARLQSVLAQLV